MNKRISFNTILELKLSGSFAHFRKFYTNASSLTYSIPPRTTFCGILASILMKQRDSYYDQMTSDKLGIAIAVWQDSGFRKQFFTTNYMGDDINNASEHKQCRLELMLPKKGNKLAWKVYVGYNDGSDVLIDSLEERIAQQNLGYGVYLGQRQFIGSLELLRKHSLDEIEYLPDSEYVDTAINKDDVVELENETCHLNLERMPLEQMNEVSGKKSFRRSIRFADVLVETSGRRLCGSFTNTLELMNNAGTRIAFL